MIDAKAEEKRLKKVAACIPEEKKVVASGLISQCSWMLAELSKLQEEISEKGWTETYNNGQHQSGTKVSACGTAFLSLQKNYAASVKKLLDLLPKTETNSSELFDWLEEHS